jgi:putative ABC transport system permease protein
VRFADLLGIALSALFQQKVRTLLTTLGVVIGTFALVVCLSLGRGFEQEVMRQLNRGSLPRQIMVWPGSGVREAAIPRETLEVHGPMSTAKRRRIRRAIIHRQPSRRGRIQLNRERVQSLTKIPHVQSAVPFIKEHCRVSMKDHALGDVTCFAANADNQHFRNRIVAGDYFHSDTGHSVVVSEYLLYLWDITDDDEVADVIGKKLRLEYRPGGQPWRLLWGVLRGIRRDLPPLQRRLLDQFMGQFQAAGKSTGQPVIAEEFTIIGVMREFLDDRDFNDVFDLGAGGRSLDADVFLPAETAAKLFAPGPGPVKLGYPGVIVTVDQERNIKEVTRAVRSQGLQEYSLAEFVQGLRTNLVLMTFVTAFLAAVALVVAALGITNTMLMTVLERTREIGVMKAVGARDGHIQLMFLLEGALIGLVGGGLGVLFGWLASFPGDSIARSLIADQALPALQHTLFVFPVWLTLGTPLFAGLVTTLAAVYPARRATRVNPILALRHE